EDRDRRPEAAPDAAHLESDDTRADDAEPLRHDRHRERARIVEDALVVERDAGQRARRRARRDDDVARAERRRARPVDGNAPAIAVLAGERAAAVERRDLVLLEEI